LSYSSPVSELLAYGDCRDSMVEWPDYRELGLGPEHVGELIEMATDEDLNWADSDSLDVWAPIHAWRALGQLRAREAIEPLLHLFHELEESDWAGEELPRVYGMIGSEAIPALERYLNRPSRGLWPRVTAARSLEQIGASDPSAREECVAVLSRQLQRFARNAPSLNGFLVSFLVDLRAAEAAPLMERAFAAGYVDPTVAGDWEDVQVEMGLKETRETPRSYSILDTFQAPEPEELRQPSGEEKAAKARSKRKQAKASRKKNRKRR
jgi:hypothetical protein